MRFLLAALVLVLAGWGANAEGIFGRPPLCKAKAVLSHTDGEGYIYQCGGCAFVVLNDNYALSLGCRYGEEYSTRNPDWSRP